MERTNIPVSKKTRKQLRVLKAEGEYRSYDELLQDMVDGEGGGGSLSKTETCNQMGCDVDDESVLVYRELEGTDSVFAYCPEDDPIDHPLTGGLFSEADDGAV